MSKARKTISVEKVKTMINHRINNSVSDSSETRKALASLLECILHETNNYHGFNYADWLDHGCDQWNADGRPAEIDKYLGDQTKVRYY